MARRPFLTKGYSNFHDGPSQEGGYGYGPEQSVKWYVVESTTVERLRVPNSSYNSFDGAPLKHEFLKEYNPRYTSNGYRESYESYHGLDYDRESPPGYYDEENLVADVFDKIQIEASRPVNTYRPVSPRRYPYQPTSSYKHRSTSLNSYRPSSPNKHQVVGPTSYRPISPTKYHHPSPTPNYPPKEAHHRAQTLPGIYKFRPISPKTYRPTSPNKYRTTSPNKYRPTSPNKYRSTNPGKYRSTSPNNYRPTSPNKYRPTSPNNYRSTSPNNYLPMSPNKYRSTSPFRSQHTSPPHNYHLKEAHLRAQTYPESTKHRHTSPDKYPPTSPSHKTPSKENHLTRAKNFLSLKKYQPTSPTHSLHSSEIQPFQTQNLSSPDKHRPSSPNTEGQHIRPKSFSGQNSHRGNRGVPTTGHKLTTPTNDIDEALSYIVEPVNYATRSNPRAQSFDQERRYTRPTFGGASTQTYVRSDTIDSQEAIKRYNGAYVP